MKKALLALGFTIMGCVPSFALSFGDVATDIRDHTKLTLLESGQPSYFFDAGNGINEAAVISPLASYRSASVVIGWAGGYDDKTVGTVLGGGQVNVLNFVHDTFPAFFGALGEHLPDSVVRLADRLRVGPAVGFNFSENKWVYGAIGGLEFKF